MTIVDSWILSLSTVNILNIVSIHVNHLSYSANNMDPIVIPSKITSAKIIVIGVKIQDNSTLHIYNCLFI